MAHFAKLNDKNIVEQVIVLNNEILLNEDGIESEELGSEFCFNHFGGRWIQTSYNGSFRGRFAGIGQRYDETLDEFLDIEIPEEIDESITEQIS